MIRKLRNKFIVMAIVSLLAVLIVILGVINIINYRSVVNEADAILDVLGENGGDFPGGKKGVGKHGGMQGTPPGDGQIKDGEMLPAENMSGSEDQEPPEDFDDFGAPDDFGMGNDDFRWDKMKGMSEETPYETRFFTVSVDPEGGITSVDVGRIAAVDSEEAAVLAQNTLAGGKERGFAGTYRYLVTEKDDSTLVIFLDTNRGLSSFRTFLLSSMLIAVIGTAAVSVLIIIFSGRITRPVAESYEKQKRFITDAGHEIKTPLAIITADVEVLEMDIEEGEENEWLSDIRMQTGRLASLTNDLIQLTRMEETPDKAAMLEFPVSEAVMQEASGFNSRAVTEGKSLKLDIKPDLSMKGNEKAIRQLTSILMDNALKYSTDNSEVVLKLDRHGRNIVLSSFNKCQPVTREQLSQMFERFYRMDASRNSEKGGYGIGLSIAQAIVTGHKGKIWASTEDGNSITITAQIPAGI